ncbi:LapA family protein [Cyanobium sp. NS01]|uniref:LapA family protein n=1 Tax=Cyanobium sp. NS01 TaxID=261284 RepID=UPI001644D7EE|nr:LapA family protein [Cyanobium sp. NS01]QNI70176.1 putative conserved membrane protein [Cyanobium sp. NS01]
MTPLLRQLLLLPLLAPLLAALLIGAFNPRPAVALRLLIWTSPALPIGVWIMVAATAGAGLSALGTGLALAAGQQRPLQRQVRQPLERENGSRGRPWPEPDAGDDAGQPEPWNTPVPAPQPPLDTPVAGPTRAAGEAVPTVAVPFRVIRRATAAAPARAKTAASHAAHAAAQHTAQAAPRASQPAAASGDDWGSPLQNEW